MKYDEVPQNYHSPYMSQVAEKLNILKMTPEERSSYSYYQKKLYNDRDELQAAEARGEARGEEKGREEGREEGVEIGEAKGVEKIAIKMLQQKLDLQLISSVTGLTIDEIKALSI